MSVASVSHIDAVLDRARREGTCDLTRWPRWSDEMLLTDALKVGILHLALRTRLLLADPVGTGKTVAALATYGYLVEKVSALRMLVLAPRTALPQWRGESLKFLRHTDAEVIGYSKSHLRMPPDERIAQWRESKANILITTYHTAGIDLEHAMDSLGEFVLTLDEVQLLRGSTDQEFLFPTAYKLSQKSRYTWGLSATPIMGKAEDIQGVMEAICPGIFGSKWHFENRYLTKVKVRVPGGSYVKTVGTQNLEEIREILAPFILRRPAEEMNKGLPQVAFKLIASEMGAQQASVYKAIESKYLPPRQLLGADGGTIQVDGKAITKLTSLNYAQMASDAPEVLGYPGVQSQKYLDIVRFLREEAHDSKFIIYSRYEQVITWLVRNLVADGVSSAVPRITGKESQRKIEAAKLAFQTNSAVRGIAIDAAGGQALNLQVADVVIFYDLPWTWGEFIQILGRARRTGSRHPKVLVVLPAHVNTIDITTLQLLADKENTIDDTLPLHESDKLFNSFLASIAPLTPEPETLENTELSSTFPIAATTPSPANSPVVNAASPEARIAALYESLRSRRGTS
jgi:SNF2 family DNA or RNA helicase